MSCRLRRAVTLLAAASLLGPALLVLATSPADAAARNLHRGSRGPAVTLLESRLYRLHLLPRAAVDRRYTRTTVRAVKRFQRAQHLRPTGRTNTRTWNLVARRALGPKISRPAPAPRVVGHRGAIRPDVPENTLASLRYATGWADVLEFDLRLTADHKLVLMHDSTLDRTTNCSGRVDTWSLADLREQCRVGAEQIPTFTEAAAYAESTSAAIAPELKDRTISDQDLAAAVDVILQHGLAERTFVQSFTGALLPRVRALDPKIRTVLCAIEPPSLPALRGAGATHVAVQLEQLSAARVDFYRRNDFAVWTYTALDRAGLVTARDRGVDAVVTDIPRQARLRYRS